MPLTDSSIRGLKPRETRYTKADGGGLSIEVLPSGKKVFKLAYRYGKQQRNRTPGPFPMLRLANARIMREKVKESLMLGRDPDEADAEALLVEQPANSDRTWRVLCEAFLEKMALEGSNPRTVAAIRNKLEKTWPTLGDRVGDEINPPDLLAVCKEIEAKGNYETANRIRSAAGRVCRYAIASGLMTRNFSDGLQGALVQPQKQGFPAITEPNEVGELLRAVWDYNGAFTTISALKLTAMTWLRSNELRGAHWTEIDWQEHLWTVPAGRMKMRRKHLVPLSRQALEVLSQLYSLHGRKSPLIFPSMGKTGRAMSENTMINALNALGYKGRHVPHGFRKTASTNLNEQGWDYRWIEKQLAHEDSNSVRRAYNSAEYLQDRFKMMQHYSDWLGERRVASQ